MKEENLKSGFSIYNKIGNFDLNFRCIRYFYTSPFYRLSRSRLLISVAVSEKRRSSLRPCSCPLLTWPPQSLKITFGGFDEALTSMSVCCLAPTSHISVTNHVRGRVTAVTLLENWNDKLLDGSLLPIPLSHPRLIHPHIEHHLATLRNFALIRSPTTWAITLALPRQSLTHPGTLLPHPTLPSIIASYSIPA